MKLWILLTIDEDREPVETVDVFGTEEELLDMTAQLLTSEVTKLEARDQAQVVRLGPVKDALTLRRIRSALDRWEELGLAPLSIRWLTTELGGKAPSQEVAEVSDRLTADLTRRRWDRAHARLLEVTRAYARTRGAEKEATALALAALKFEKADRRLKRPPPPRRPLAKPPGAP